MNNILDKENCSYSISFFIPAYNCAFTIREAIDSILQGNFNDGDELIIVNDGSTDNTALVLNEIQQKYPFIQILHHARNKGGGAARNTAVEQARNEILFCLDSDNILVPGSIQRLASYLIKNQADVAAFQEIRFFTKNSINQVTHKWFFCPGLHTLSECLSGAKTPGASGNYMFTKKSWSQAGGYPEFAGALDAWGFGFRQLATGSKMIVMENSFYFHRYGHESYWVRESQSSQISLLALQIVISYLDLLNEEDIDFIMSKEGRYTWFQNLEEHPIRVKGNGNVRRTGQEIVLKQPLIKKIKRKAVKIVKKFVQQKIWGKH